MSFPTSRTGGYVAVEGGVAGVTILTSRTGGYVPVEGGVLGVTIPTSRTGGYVPVEGGVAGVTVIATGIFTSLVDLRPMRSRRNTI